MTMLDNGAVLPQGLLNSDDDSAMMAGFNKTYRNAGLRVGVVVACYPKSDSNNITKLANEYDVLVIEQHEDKGATSIVYRNCLSQEGLGSIADFFEKTLRPLKKKTTKGESINLKGQDGAIVLLLCLDSMSDKGVIISGLTHPDRPTTISNEGPRLEGEFNGINIKVETDGSTSLTFNGATDNSGKVIDSSQKATVFQIQKDGSFNILNAAGSMFNMTKDGSYQILTSNGNSIFLNDKTDEISVNQKDGSIVGLSSKGVTISDSTGKQIVSLTGDTVQLTSGNTLVEQSKSHTISSGGVAIKGAGGVTVKDMLGAGFSVKNGMVAIGGPAGELLDLFGQLLLALTTLLTALSASAITAGPNPVTPPLAVATAPALITIAQIQILLTLIKGSL